MTFLGLGGIGDLIVTCTSTHSRNFTLGYKLGQGESMDQALSEMNMVVEGIYTTKSVYHLAKEKMWICQLQMHYIEYYLKISQ